MTAVPAAAAVLVHGAGPAARLGQNCNSVEPHDVAAAAAVVAAAVAPAAAADQAALFMQWVDCCTSTACPARSKARLPLLLLLATGSGWLLSLVLQLLC
jgi:hypothetical protein